MPNFLCVILLDFRAFFSTDSISFCCRIWLSHSSRVFFCRFSDSSEDGSFLVNSDSDEYRRFREWKTNFLKVIQYRHSEQKIQYYENNSIASECKCSSVLNIKFWHIDNNGADTQTPLWSQELDLFCWKKWRANKTCKAQCNYIQ